MPTAPRQSLAIDSMNRTRLTRQLGDFPDWNFALRYDQREAMTITARLQQALPKSDSLHRRFQVDSITYLLRTQKLLVGRFR
jgi:hypothetical protein